MKQLSGQAFRLSGNVLLPREICVTTGIRFPYAFSRYYA
jgi:hypothetical protein